MANPLPSGGSSSMASAMATAVNLLGEAFRKFSSGTITEAIWNGEAADNANTQITSKIDPKVEDLKTKLNNLQQAIDLIGTAETAKGNMDEFERALSSLDSKADDYFSKRREYRKGYKESKKLYEDSIEQIRKLCGS